MDVQQVRTKRAEAYNTSCVKMELEDTVEMDLKNRMRGSRLDSSDSG